MIIVIGCLKGGVGKSTLATNLTVLRAASGKKVLLVDADEQKSTTNWVQQRETREIKTDFTTIQLTSSLLRRQIEKMISDYDDIIIDTSARHTPALNSAVSASDILLIPFKPRSFDTWTFPDMRNFVIQMKASNPKLKTLAIINQADSIGKLNQESFDLLKDCEDIECVPFSIGSRKAFAHAASEGKGVIELKNNDKKAIQEITKLYEFIYE